ncbi:hypothetical protein NMG60_11012049 [Bertholletia excelsa]
MGLIRGLLESLHCRPWRNFSEKTTGGMLGGLGSRLGRKRGMHAAHAHVWPQKARPTHVMHIAPDMRPRPTRTCASPALTLTRVRTRLALTCASPDPIRPARIGLIYSAD